LKRALSVPSDKSFRKKIVGDVTFCQRAISSNGDYFINQQHSTLLARGPGTIAFTVVIDFAKS